VYKKLTVLCFTLLFLTLAPSFAQEDEKVVVLHTKSGKIVIEFFPEDAPGHVENFLSLTESGFYDRTVFHRIIKDFMIQGGDPKSKPGGYTQITEWGTGDPGYSIPAEFNDIKHIRGIVSMARSADPDSAGSQFFVVHKDSTFLDGQYTVFGRIITQESYDTLDTIASLEIVTLDVAKDWGVTEINKAEIVDRSEIKDILDLGELERITESTPEIIVGTTEQTNAEYVNEKLGISFTAPEGWLIQEPPKTQANTPDIVAVGPTINNFTPAISIMAINNTDNISLAEKFADFKNSLSNSINQGQLTILSEEKTTINGKDVYITEVSGNYTFQSQLVNVKFREVLLSSSDKFYTITYTNAEDNFDSYLPQFETLTTSFTITGENGGGCLIATAAYGSELAPQVQMLRELRDNTVLSTTTGASFMTGFNTLYYSFSPTISDWERQNPMFQEAVRVTITPLISTLSILNYVDVDSDAEMLGYGIGIIMLNVGMYFVAPAVIIYRIFNRK